MSGRIISVAESWQAVYQAYQNVNFTAFDYQTIKQSLIDYIKLYFPENFNDFIESSEFIALIELFAYLGELMAYRVDMMTHENFLPTAQRKQSVLRLAKLIAYNASRNIPARGMVKITSVSTTETVYDSNGTNLAGRKINWNDPSNSNWKDQFILVMDRALSQPFGSVFPADRVQVQNVLFELYSMENVPFNPNVIPYSVSVSGQNYNMELVSAALNDNGPYEKRPEINVPMNILYGSDGLGDSSSGTGFFFYTKQGKLNLISQTFDGVTPNQTFDIGVTNINQTDVWVNNVSSDTLQIITGSVSSGSPLIQSNRSGEWVPVDLAQAQNIIYNTNIIRNKYEIETLNNDDVLFIFGDGEFATIPNGLFHFWVRTSANLDLVIPQSAINNIPSSLTYIDVNGNGQTLSFTFSATTTFQNAAPSEDIEHIRRMAPSVYYTQDRMVNGNDYNSFMLQDQTILKIVSFNRTFAGESNYTKYLEFNDPSGEYDNIKIFGDDLSLFVDTNTINLPDINAALSSTVVVQNYVQPLLSNIDLYMTRAMNGNDGYVNVTTFTQSEINTISNVDYSSLTAYLFYNTSVNPAIWDVETIQDGASLDPVTGDPIGLVHNSSYALPWVISITKGSTSDSWKVSYKGSKIIAESPSTKFFSANQNQVVNFDSLVSGYDSIVILKANEHKNRTGVLTSNVALTVTGQEFVTTGSGPITDIGLPNTSQLNVTYPNTNGNLLPDFPSSGVPLSDLIGPSISITQTMVTGAGGSYFYEFPFPILRSGSISDILISPATAIDTSHSGTAGGFITPVTGVVTGVYLKSAASIQISEYVYLTRPTTDSYWSVMDTTPTNLELFLTDTGNLYERKTGRSGFNFMWMHRTPNNRLIDPAAMNIIDTYIVTRGYYLNMRNWLSGFLPNEPDAPTPLDLLTSYSYLINNKMISDSLILHTGKFKILFGTNAPNELQARFKVIKSQNSTLTDNQIKLSIISKIQSFFDITQWEFGDTFYFTELAAVIHATLPVDIESVVIVPQYSSNYFGDLFQVYANVDELFIPDVTINDIDIVSSFGRSTIKQS
jgi:hypothetical protein